MKIKIRNLKIYLDIFMIVLISCFITFLLLERITDLYIVSLFVLICNITIGLLKKRENIAFILFNISLFCFLLGKPLGAYFLGINYWESQNNTESSIFTLTAIFLSLVSFYFAASIKYKRQTLHKKETLIEDYNYLQRASFVIYIISFFMSSYEWINRLIYFKTHSYLDFYNGGYTTDYLPIIVKVFMQLLLPSLSIVLATFPKRSKGYIVLCMHIISTIPTLIVGQRAPFVLACFFVVCYCIMRDSLKKDNINKKALREWLSGTQIKIGLLLLPLCITFLTVYNELRNNLVISGIIKRKLNHPISYFLYEQGGTMDLFYIFYSVKDSLPPINYLGGYLHDAFFYNEIIAKLFGITTYPKTSVEYLKTTHTLASHLSYAYFGDAYFEGNGTDSSFLLDIFANYSWIGIVIISFVLAMYLLGFFENMKKGWLTRTVVIYSFFNIFFLPRAMFMVPFSFIISPYFWSGVLLCYILKVAIGGRKEYRIL